MNTVTHAIAFLALATLWTGIGHAGEVLLYRQGETPDPGEIAKVFGAPQAAATAQAPLARTKTRGLRLLSEAPPAALPAPEAALHPAPASAAPAAGAVALQVQFPFDSAEIQPEMLPALDAVAAGIKLAGGATRIVVEGHTDAAGAADYNLRLSQRRAAAVRHYLIVYHGIAPQRLDVVGLGKSAPLFPQDPYAAENRRVQFRAVDASPTQAHGLSPGEG